MKINNVTDGTRGFVGEIDEEKDNSVAGVVVEQFGDKSALFCLDYSKTQLKRLKRN